MAKKLPWLKWWPDKWLSDEKLRSCSLSARGLWADMLSLMHKSDCRGHLEVNGKPVSVQQLSRMVGCLPDEVSRALAELSSAGVFSVRADGVFFSRLMVDEETKSMACRIAGKKGGNPALKGGDKPSVKEREKLPLSSILLTESAESNPQKDGGVGEGSENLQWQKNGICEFDLTPEGLAQQWTFRYLGQIRQDKDPVSVARIFKELIEKLSLPPERILHEIQDPKRLYSEPLWDMQKRLAPSKNGNGHLDPVEERIARAEKAMKDRRIDSNAKAQR